MTPPYTIRRRVSDYRWEYLKNNGYSKYGYKFRANSMDKAIKKLSELPSNENWIISCRGS